MCNKILRTSLFLILLSPVIGPVSNGFAEVINGIACKVGSDIITINEFNREYERAAQRAGIVGVDKPSKKEIMELLVNNLLIMNEAEKRGIVVMEEEIDAIIEDIKKQEDMSEEEFMEQLELEKLTLAELRDQYTRELIRTRFINSLISTRINIVDEAEIVRFYDDPANKKHFVIPAIVKLTQIYIQVPEGVSYQEAVTVKNRAREVYEEAKSGKSFEELVMIHSEAESKEENRGFLGSFTKEQLASFMKGDDINMIFSLEKGDIVPPLRFQDGYYILKIEDKTEQSVMDFEEARENIRGFLLRQRGEEEFKFWISEARAATKILYMIAME